MASLSGPMTFPPPTFIPEGAREAELGVELEAGGEVKFLIMFLTHFSSSHLYFLYCKSISVLQVTL